MLGIQVSSSRMCHIYNKEEAKVKQTFLLSKKAEH